MASWITDNDCEQDSYACKVALEEIRIKEDCEKDDEVAIMRTNLKKCAIIKTVKVFGNFEGNGEY